MSPIDIFKKLEHLIKIKIDKLIHVDKSVHIHIDNRDQDHSVDKSSKTVNISYPKVDKEELKQFVKKAIEEDDYLLLENNSKIRLEDFKSKDETSERRKILELFRTKIKIPPNDYDALRASLYMKDKFEERQDITDIKKDIIKRYGERGKNICNLCTAGYFEKWIIPLYYEMEKEPGFTLEKFLENYEVIITKSAFSVFVSREMKDEEVKETILKKIKSNKSYGIKYVTIHGIGRANVRKIRETISEFEDSMSFIKDIDEKQNVIIARLTFD